MNTIEDVIMRCDDYDRVEGILHFSRRALKFIDHTEKVYVNWEFLTGGMIPVQTVKQFISLVTELWRGQRKPLPLRTSDVWLIARGRVLVAELRSGDVEFELPPDSRMDPRQVKSVILDRTPDEKG